MVESNAGIAEAHFRRYRFFRTTPEADTYAVDLARALELDPDEPRYLIAAGEDGMRTGRPDSALKHYQRAKEADPEDYRPYLGLGMAEMALDDSVEARKRATQIWAEGRKVAEKQGDPSGELALTLYEAIGLIGLNQMSEAEQRVAMLDQMVHTIPTDRRAAAMSVIAFLKGNIDYEQGRTALAARRLEAASSRLKEASVASFAGQAIAKRILRGLADCYNQLAQWDRAAAAYEELSQRTDATAAEMLAAAQCWIAAGRFDRAVVRARAAAGQFARLPQAQLVLAIASIRSQLERSASDRDWLEAERALGVARKLKAEPTSFALAAAELARARGDDDDALQTLAEAQKESPDDPRVAQALAEQLAKSGASEQADELIADLKSAQGEQGVVTGARILIQAARYGDAVATLKELAESDAPLSAEAQWITAEAHRLNGATDRAIQSMERLATQHPDELRYHMELGNLLQAEQDFARLGEVITSLRRIEGESGVYWRNFEAIRLMAASSPGKPGFAEAKNLIEDIARLRSDWAGGRLLSAEWNRRAGKIANALDDYEQAIALGERSPETIAASIRLSLQRRTQLLAARSSQTARIEADALLAAAISRLEARDDIREHLELLDAALQVAQAKGDRSQTLDLARTGAETGPGRGQVPHRHRESVDGGRVHRRTGRTGTPQSRGIGSHLSGGLAGAGRLLRRPGAAKRSREDNRTSRGNAR